jgi:hypothetical protein
MGAAHLEKLNIDQRQAVEHGIASTPSLRLLAKIARKIAASTRRRL